MSYKRLRDMTWEDYGISRNRYQELKSFCLQYEEKKSKITRGIGGMQYTSMPGSSGPGKAVENQAVRNVTYQNDIDMIEEAAKETSKELAPYILKSVTNDLPYSYIEYDSVMGRIPVGKTEFYGYRRLFYSVLDKKKLGTK